MDENIQQKFLKLLDYQKKDIELRKINDALARDESRLVMNKNKKLFDEAKNTIAECEKQASAIMNLIDEMQKYVADNEKLLTDMENVDVDDVEDFNEYMKKLESLKSKFQAADKRVHDLDAKGKAVVEERKNALRSGKNAQAKHAEAKEKHAQLLNSKSDEMNKLKSELESIRRELDTKLLEEYNRLVSENKFPPVAPARTTEKGVYNCGGCGISLPQKDNALLKDKGWCRCENCRRLVVSL